MSTNIRSLRNKVDLLHAEISRIIPQIIAVQETWLGSEVDDSSVSIPSYSVVRHDRSREGGGTAFYIHESLGYPTPVLNLDPDIECLCLDVHFGRSTIRLLNVYRTNQAQWLNKFRAILEIVCATKNNLFLMGDFNYDYLNPEESRGLRNLLTSFNQEQHVSAPTRYGNQRNSCLDLFISCKSNLNVVRDISVIPPYASDHCTVVAEVGRPAKQNAVLKTQWLYHGGDYAGLSSAIADSNWDFIEDPGLDVDGAAEQFCTQLDSLLRTYIPTRQFLLRPNDAPWMTPDIRRAQRQRDRVHMRAKTVNTPELWERYRAQRNLVNSMIKSAKRSSTDALIDQVNTMSQSKSDWWKLIKKCVSPSHNSIPTLVTKTGGDVTYHTDDYSKATVLNKLFTEVTKINEDNATFPQLTALTNARLDLIHVTLNDVKLSIHQLK